MKIDAHQHFWKYDPVRDAWIDDSMEVIRSDFLPKHLRPVLEANSVDGCVAIQADQTEKETEFLLQCAKENPFIKGVVGWVDLRSETLEERLSHFAKHSLFKGVRHIVQAEANDFMLGNNFQNGISKLAQFNLTYDILIFPTQLKVAIELVNKFPKQKFIVDHMAKPYIKAGKINSWKTDMLQLAKAPNVYCKISGMVTEADFKEWKVSDFKAYLEVVFDAFGVDRVVYGSDWPVCLLAAKYEQQLNIVEDYIKGFSEADKEKIMGKNAVAFYNL